MTRDIKSQLGEYFSYIDDTQGSVDVLNVTEPVTPLPALPDPGRGIAGWWVGVAAAIAVLVLIGPVVLLVGNTDLPPANSPDDATFSVTVTTSTLRSPDAVVIPSGPIRFTSIVAPSETAPPGFLTEAVWFGGSLYAVAQGGLYSTSDGFVWVEENDATVGLGVGNTLLDTDGSTLVVATLSEPEIIGSVYCSQPGDLIHVDVLDDQGVWTSSQIDLPITRPSTSSGCLNFWMGDIAVGPAGILVAGSISAEVPYEAIILEQFGQEVVDSLDSVSPVGDTMVVVSGGGARTDVIDLAELGLADQISEFADYAREVIGSSGTGFMWFGEQPFAWWSADGQVWTEVDRSGGPMLDHQIQFVMATESGFLVTSEANTTQELVEGSIWRAASAVSGNVHRWGDRLVVEGPNGVSLLDDPEQVLIPKDAVAGYKLYFGEMGVIGVRGEGYERRLATRGEMGVIGGRGEGYELLVTDEPIFFSANGTTWETWIPPEFETMDQWVNLVGVGDNFVVLSDWVSGTLWIGTVNE
jgi:hypothetical protein